MTLFARVIVVDWSAAASPGPPRPSPDRCWLAWADAGAGAGARPAAEYFRTRAACEARIAELIAGCDGPVLAGFDFPFGYPDGSGLGGGRAAAARLAALIADDPGSGANNRFAVAARLNREIGPSPAPGPFWGVPPARAEDALAPTRPDFAASPFAEKRIAEARLRDRGHPVMTTWQLLGRGSVGGQVLMGLPALDRLARHPDFGPRVRYWPFETDWAARLDGVVLTEIWPSLSSWRALDLQIRDAAQVTAQRDAILGMTAAELVAALARPDWLDARDTARVMAGEGWIFGITEVARPG
ncbi:hypothetical protein [Oceanibacterium hippocampi]|uniref:hypothetical protein n=1 Tax=Oceanibacterium hippocampi TaxID=745714 RepID=UPI00111C4B44|nr:hypothetical protein [Oceanibacterium hippocampi]